jgi:hypothetical protein
MTSEPADQATASLIERWQAAWPSALAAWSKFTRLSDPRRCASLVEASAEGLSGSFAMIRLADQSVVVDLESVRALGLEDYGVEVLAHEIGHHVLAPANATDHYRLLARIRRALPTLERHAAMVANLFTDLLINDRLQRQAGLRMADIYRRLHTAGATRDSRSKKEKAKAPGVWALYMRIYEQLWQLDKGALGAPTDNDKVDADAWLGARLIRAYANDWLDAGGRFATLLLPYLLDEDPGEQKAISRIHDTKDAAQGSEPSGLTEIDGDEAGGAIHPSEDPRVTGEEPSDRDERARTPEPTASNTPARGQRREPFEYGEILKASGIKLSDHEIAVRYYRESALPYLIPFPQRIAPQSEEPQVEGLESWDVGDPLDEIDWLGTVTQSPRLFPGLTTVKRQYGKVEGQTPARIPIDLDLYVDCSGSMPNPQQRVSYLALAGAVIVLSALRVGSRVQATLWSGAREFLSTPGFVRDEDAILKVLTGYLGGGTAFPIHKLRDTFDARRPNDRACHILVISDDGVTTMFDKDERGNSGWDIAARALAAGRAGGTMALNLPAGWDKAGSSWFDPQVLKRAAREQGWEIHAIARIEDLVEFARAFSRRRFGQESAQAPELAS